MRKLIMLRPNLLMGLLLAAFIMAMPTPVAATNYYVDATNGNDSNDGTSPSAAWQTLIKVSRSSFSPGDSILFKRGEVWRGDLDIYHSGTPDSPIVYGAYGEGKKPLFHKSVNMNKTSDWTSVGTNLWATDNYSFLANTGFILFGEERTDNVGDKSFSFDTLDVDKEFWYDTINKRVIVYCTQNPALEYSSIEIAQASRSLDHFITTTNVNYIHIENFDIRYFFSCAMAFTNSKGFEVRNCHISYGGGQVYYGQVARLGNGIELYNEASDFILENCRIGKCFDSGIMSEDAHSTVSNITIRNNIFYGNDLAAVEIGYSGESISISNYRIENNIFTGNGYGWSHEERRDDTGWDVTTWTTDVGSWDGFYIHNNVFYEAGRENWHSATYRFMHETNIANFEVDYNYYFKTVYPYRFMIHDHENNYKMDEFADYQKEMNRDLNSSAGSRAEAQKIARSKVSCEDLFFLNTLFQEYDDSTLTGNAPSVFDLTSPADKELTLGTVTLTWGTSVATGSALDHYEVWIDCEHVANVASGTTSYQASLTDGEHNWFVIAVCQDSVYWRQSTNNRTFMVNNSTSAHILTVESGTGGGYYQEDDVANVSPNTPLGKGFNQWTGETQYLNSPVTTANNSVTMPAGNVSISATYDNIAYTLTVEDGSGSGTDYIYEQVVDIIANTAPEGYKFAQWTGDVVYIDDVKNPKTTITMPAEDITIQATYLIISDDLPLFSWNMEASNVVLDEGSAIENLTNNTSVTTGGTEPNPPGYGSVGAIFNGTDQYLTLSNGKYGDRALNGTDTDGTIYLAFNPDNVSQDAFLWSFYSVSAGRQLALSFDRGVPEFYFGYNNGNSYQAVKIPYTFSANDDIIIGLSLDANSKEYTFLAKDILNDKYYSMTNSDEALTGTYNAGIEDLVIGGRSDLFSDWFFDGTIYWVHVYDETHTPEKMKEIMETNNYPGEKNTFANSPAVSSSYSVYPNPAQTELTIHSIYDNEGKAKVEIYNQIGKRVYHSSDEVTFPYQVDASSFSAGIYLIKVSDGDNQEIVKIIKK